MQFLIALAEIFSAIGVAIAAWISYLSVKRVKEQTDLMQQQVALAHEEGERNRESFKYTSQPLLEITFDIRDQPLDSNNETVGPDQFVFPWTRYDGRVVQFPRNAQEMIVNFDYWRQEYQQEENENIDSPHPYADYLIMNVKNLQPNQVGQTVEADLLIEFEYTPSSVGIKRLSERNHEPSKVHVWLKMVGRVGPLQDVSVWLAYIQNIPNLVVRTKMINCKTWGGITVERGMGEEIDLSDDGSPSYRMNMLEGSGFSSLAETPVYILPYRAIRRFSE